MHSKVLVNDFFEKKMWTELSGFCSLQAADEYVWPLISPNLNQDIDWKNIFAEDLSADFLETKLCNLSFFSESNNYIVHRAHSINKPLQTWIVENSNLFSGTNFIFLFNENKPWRKKWWDLGKHFSLEPPKFWTSNETLSLICRQMKIDMDAKAKQVFVEKIPFTWKDYCQNLMDISSTNRDRLTGEYVDSFFKKQKVDKFHLANLLGRKQEKQFWQEIVELDITLDEHRDLFAFLQTHLFKILNVNEIKSKSYKNKYEQEIIGQSRFWDKASLVKTLRDFSDIELKIKMKNSFVYSEFKKRSLVTSST